MPTGGLGRVLIVDDEVELMNALVETLNLQGYEATGFTSGSAALEVLETREFDVLLSDLMMPETDGVSLLQAALQADPNLVGIIITGRGTVQTAVEAMKVGAFDYVLKPFKLQALLPVLARAMQLGRVRKENLQLREALAIYELGQMIAYTLEPGTILDKLADAALGECEADDVSIMLPTRDGTELYVAAVRGGKREELIGQRVSVDRGVAGWVAQHPDPLILHGQANDPRFGPASPHRDIASAIVHPLLAGGKLVGILNVNRTGQRRPYTLGQMKALTILANLAAAALESAAAYTEARRAEEQVRLVIETANDAFVGMDADGRITDWNRQAELMFGWSRDEVIGRSLSDVLIPPRYREQHQQGLERFLATGEGPVLRSRMEVTALHRDAHEFPVEVGIWPVFTDGRYRFSGLVRDLTELKQREEALRESEERLRQAQKMEAIGLLAGGVAHDFNNILTAIIGFSRLLLSELDAANPLHMYAEEIAKAGDRAASLIGQLLAFSRRQVLHPEILDLNVVVKDIDKLLQRVIGEDVDLVSIRAPELGRVKADRGQIEQIIVNLAVNARDAMPQGGKLTIETANVELDDTYSSQHFSVEPGSYVMLAVSDTGCGMDQETQGRVFEPFFTTKGPGKGTGLGLSTVYGVVKQSQGYIWVYSAVGVGTTFKIYLPRTDEAVRPPASSVALPRSGRGVETILLVEDDAGIRALARAVLRSGGYTVLEAEDPDQALAMSQQHEGHIDLLLSDVVMPGMNGRELADRLVRERPDLKVLHMSGYTDDVVVRHGVLEAEMAYLEKPFAPDALARKVREVLGTPRGAGDGDS